MQRKEVLQLSMDSAFDLTKENIQPLAQGRNTLQFEAAIQAQNNPEAHQELMKIAENYELGLRMYDGDDPLAPWYEYICWVEQSFPKGGKEGNLSTLLEKCLTHFKDNKTYFQDGRLIRLWIKYIDGKGIGISRAELYRMAHCHGVGTQSSLFYRFWAYELERSGDHKSADAIYRMGLEHNAQPKEELINAQANFTARMAQIFLNGTAPPPQRPDSTDRLVLAALRAKKKNLVQNVRLGGQGGGAGGNNVRPDRRHTAAAANQLQQPTLKIFMDAGDSENVNAPSETMRSLPKQSIVNKENAQNAGPWTGPPRRKTLPAPITLAPTSRPAFQVHTDNLPAAPRELPWGSVMNALETVHDDFDDVPYAIFEEPNPLQRCMYPKAEVYSGGKEYSPEELMAARWFKKEAAARNARLEKEREAAKQLAAEQARLQAEQEERNIGVQLKFSQQSSNDSVSIRSQSDCDSTDAPQFSDPKKCVFARPSSAAFDSKVSYSDSKNSSSEKTPPRNPRRKTMILKGSQDDISDDVPNRQSEQESGILCREPESRTANRRTTETREFSRMSIKERSRDLLLMSNESCSSTEPSMLHSQSITVNTKEAMNVMNELWGSTCDRTHQSRALALPTALAREACLVAAAASLLSESKEENVGICIPPREQIAPFTIFSGCESLSNVVRSVKTEFTLNATEEEVQSKENVAYSRRTISMTVHTDDEDDDVVPQLAKIANDFVIYQETDNAKNENNNLAQKYPADSVINNFVIYQESDDNLENCTPWPTVPVPGNIPLVPSPGMSRSQIQALDGTDFKENVAAEPPPEDERVMAGILQPSLAIPFEPYVDSEPIELKTSLNKLEKLGFNLEVMPSIFQLYLKYADLKHVEKYLQRVAFVCQPNPADDERLEPTEFFTQQFTQAFNFPLTTSTPFHGNVKTMSPVVEVSETSPAGTSPAAHATVDSQSPTEREPQTHNLPATSAPINLSVIMENSKENYRSSSSSGSSCGTTTRRTFSVSTWSAQESMQRTGREKSLAAIQEHNKESLIEAEGDLSSVAKAVADAELFALPALTNAKNGSLTDICQEDLFTMGVFNLTKKDVLIENEGVQGSIYLEESRLEILGGSIHEKSIQYGHKLESSFDNLQISQEDEGDLYAISKQSSRKFDESLRVIAPGGCESIDPFDEELIGDLLMKTGFPQTEKKYIRMSQNLPNSWKPGSSVKLGSDSWEIAGMVGKGAYAKVVKGLLTQNRCSKPKVKALKIQKPSWVWELYISCQIHKRLTDKSLAKAFMEVDQFYEFNNGSVFTCDFCQYGTLLTVANKLHAPSNIIRTMVEPIAMYLAMELLQIVDALQKCHIIHADIKPDNFMLRNLLSKEPLQPTLQLIDFGRAIDLTLFPAGTSFKRVVNTESFTCVEMQSARPWTHQTDYFGMASTVHCLLLGGYMETVCTDGIWSTKNKIPRNHKSAQLWKNFFHVLLNIKSCEEMPNLEDLRNNFELEFDRKRFNGAISTFNNLMLDN